MTIGQIAINVNDVARATAFYRDKLGLTFLFDAGGMAFLDCGGVRLMLSASQAGVANSILYFKTPDLSSLADKMKADGVAFEQGPHLVAKMPDHELWMAFFRDSENNLMALMSELR